MIVASAATRATIDARAQDHDALRHIVQEQRVPHWLQEKNPAPCALVTVTAAPQDADSYAVLPDIKGGAHFLLIPIKNIAGIESTDVLKPSAPNYFAAAWQARDQVAGTLGRALRRNIVGLAVNSREHRSQDQLHTHIECLGPAAFAVLQAAADRLSERRLTLQGAPTRGCA